MEHPLPRRALAGVATLTLALTGALVAAQPAAAADDRLVAHYPLTETSGTTAADVSGAGRNASYVGGPGLTGGEGVRLDGTDDDRAKRVHDDRDALAALRCRAKRVTASRRSSAGAPLRWPSRAALSRRLPRSVDR